MSTDGKTLKFRAAKLKGFTVTRKYRHKQFSVKYKTGEYNPHYKIEIFLNYFDKISNLL